MDLKLMQILLFLLTIYFGNIVTKFVSKNEQIKCNYILESQSVISTSHLWGILEKILKETKTLQVWFTATTYTNCYVQWFLRQTYVPFTVNTLDTLFENYNTSIPNISNNDHYAITINITSLVEVIEKVCVPTGLYFFILYDDNNDYNNNNELNIEKLNVIFQTLWKQCQIWKIFLLYKMGIFVYDPFHLNTNKTYGSIIQYNDNLMNASLEEQLFRNMHGYPLQIQIFQSSYARLQIDPETNEIKYIYGVDGRIADLLQEYLNFTMILQEPNPNYFGERFLNGSYNGAIGALIEKKFDLCLTGFFFTNYEVPEMDFSVALYDDKVLIYTQKAKRVPESILPLVAVHRDLWFSFLLTPLLCSIIWILLRLMYLKMEYSIFKYKTSILQQYGRIFIDIWVIWVRTNISHYPPFAAERIFILSICLVSVIFGAIIESSLATAYIYPLYFKNIKTLKELDESGMSIVYKYASIGDNLFFEEISPLYASLNSKLLYLRDFKVDIFQDVAEKGGKAGLTRSTNLMFKKLKNQKAAKDIWLIPEVPKSYLISYVWHKDVPWKNSINRWLLRFLSEGFFAKFLNDIIRDTNIKMMKQQTIEVDGKVKILSVDDLQLAFYILLIGTVTAGITLFIEINLHIPLRMLPFTL